MSSMNIHPLTLDFPALVRFFSTPDTVHYLLNTLDFTSLTVFASLNRSCRRVVKRLIRTRIYSILTPYVVEKNDVDALFYLLGNARGAIFGSVALAVLTPPLTRDWSPNNLNLIAVGKRAGCLIEMFEDMDYSFTTPSRPRNSGTKRYWVGTKHSRDRRRTWTVTISQSTDNTIFPPLIGSDTTSKMNFVTQIGVFCLYPQLTSRLEALSIGDMPEEGEVLAHRSRSITLVPNTASLTHNCGFECPKLWRRLRGGRGVRKFNWHYADEESTLDTFLDRFEYMWKLGESCLNPHCGSSQVI